MTVQQHLDAAWGEHTRYRRAAGSIHGSGHPNAGDPASLADYHLTLQACRAALEHRQAAHALDPEHADPAWRQEKAPHAQMVEFYEKYIRETEAFLGVERVALPDAVFVEANPCEAVKIDGLR